MPQFTWGDSVVVARNAPQEYRPGELASVCGIREVENSQQQEEFGVPIGSTIYLIEYGDGESTEIAESLLHQST